MVSTLLVRLIGGVCLAFGIALAILAIMSGERLLITHSLTNATVPTMMVSVVSAFLLLVGCRLLFNRPTGKGSVLSPPGWVTLAILFFSLCVISIAEAASKREHQLLVVAAGFGILGYGCLKAGKTARIGPIPSQIFTPETSLLSIEGFVPNGFLCGIELLNDDRTPMEFVVAVLQRDAGLNRVEAMRTMLEIHNKGGKVLPLQSFKQSMRVAESIATKARGMGFPLVCRAVRL